MNNLERVRKETELWASEMNKSVFEFCLAISLDIKFIDNGSD